MGIEYSKIYKEGKSMLKAYEHFKTITKHRHEVIKNCAKAGILFQGLFHDLSKYSLAEFGIGAKFYQGTRSPNEGEREAYGYSIAWMHHKGRNKHHYEYWTDYSPKDKKVAPVKMPLKYVIEMFCDRVAASKIYQKEKYTDSSAFEYFENGHAKEMMHQETAALLEKLLRLLKDQGEDAAFKYIRQLAKQKDY